jgi:hypothetical protein
VLVEKTSGYALDSTLVLGVAAGSGRCRRLSANHCFVEEPIFSKRRLLRLLLAFRCPDGFCCPNCTNGRAWRSSRGALALWWMSQASFRSGWNGFPRHRSANENLVSSVVVYHQSEKWGERSGAAKSSRPWQLPDGLVNVAQTSAGHGKARAGKIVWRG